MGRPFGYDCPNLRLVKYKIKGRIHRRVVLKCECALELFRGLVKTQIAPRMPRSFDGKRTSFSTEGARKTGYSHARE